MGRIRIIVAVLMFMSVLAFQIGGGLTKHSYGHKDVWVDVTEEDLESAKHFNEWQVVVEDSKARQLGFKGLADVASGYDLSAKRLEFWGEFLAGFFMIISHL